MMEKMKEQNNFIKRVIKVCMKIWMSAIKVNAVLLSPSQSNKYYFCIKEGHICPNCKKYWELIDTGKVHINEN